MPSSKQIRPDWWTEPEDRIHDILIPYVDYLVEEQDYRTTANLTHMRMYGGFDYSGLYGRDYVRRRSDRHLKLNIVSSTVNTATSKIAKNKPRILALTEGGSWSQQFRGEKLTKSINGVFHESNLYSNMRAAFRNACIFDMGAVMLFSESGRIFSENVFPQEIVVDDIEAQGGMPRQLHRCKLVSREVLLEKFPEHKDAIMAAPSADVRNSTLKYTADMVRIVQSWHLQSTAGASDGLTAIAIENATLSISDWPKPYFPFVFLRWQEMPVGFYGQGHASILAGLQYEVNKLLSTIEEHLDLGVGFVAVEAASGANLSHVETNDIYRILSYNGVPPQIVAPPPVAQAYLQQLENLYRKSFEIVGISQLAATARKPEGLNSGRALREFNDIESERFQDVSLRYEEAFVRAGDIVFDLLEDIYRNGQDPTVRLPGQGFMETVDWSKARMDRDDFILRLVPTSFLPSTPAGKFATIQEMLQAGLLTREEGLLLLDYPDLEKINSLNNSQIRNIDRKIEKILDPENPQRQSPEPFTNHRLALQRAISAYEHAALSGAPEENLELLTRFMEDNNFYIEQAQIQQQILAQSQVQ